MKRQLRDFYHLLTGLIASRDAMPRPRSAAHGPVHSWARRTLDRQALRPPTDLTGTWMMLVIGLALVGLMAMAPPAQARGGVAVGGVPNAITVGPATPAGGPVPFDITGAIQSLTVFISGNAYSGGTIVVNGITVIIPANLVVTLPAAYKTVGQLFIDSPVPNQSGLALNDTPPPIAAYEAGIAGNIVNGVYLAGLVSIAPQSLNTANGFIRSINYATGEMCIGSTPGTCALSGDARVIINDPDGRYGLANGGSKASPDPRFGVDSDNPTVHAASGYPMCLPRVAPSLDVDLKCPMSNRPTSSPGVFLTTFVMDINQLTPPPPFVGGAVAPCGTGCNVNEQAPLVVGDYIAYSGILAKDSMGIYVAAYSIEANVGIYTPATKTTFYMYVEAPLISTGPASCPANAECQARLRTSIFVTDPSRTPAMYAVDENPAGARTSRALVSTLINTAVLGRFVFHTEKDTRVFGGASGVTREIMGRVAGTTNDGTPVYYGNTVGVPTAANGLVFGQYVSPVGEYIFPEPNVGGAVLTPYNFRCLAFLAKGWGQGGALPGIGQLTPFPEATAPATVNCTF